MERGGGKIIMAKEEIVKILSTESYGMFKVLNGNRPLNKGLLVSIHESVENDGDYLKYNPIIVNEKMEVIDGQHRLKVAEEAGVPIYYVVAEGFRLKQAQILNSRKRQWTSNDFLQSYITEDMRDYKEIQEYMKEYRFSVAIVTKFLSRNINSSVMIKFREGKFEVVDREWGENGLGLLSTIREHSPDYCYGQSSCQIAVAIMLDKLSDPKEFERKLEQYQTTVTRRNSSKDYLKQFQLILDMGGASKTRLL